MTTISITDFALHIQSYLDQALQGESIKIHLQNGQYIALVAEDVKPIEKNHTKADFLELLSYQGGLNDSQDIDTLIY
ncbi:hypothetical protein KFZ76_04040 [Methylovulum psychrotolerans]|uniref:hypothetical protein n=1 Tax=Methylovulum psychrotolerans TaxID=1704499 RepID=UPI001BFF984B|nr:hypothetical protein [Methylovulum psychrotolerans]MBT9096882.1 hypothetical protein [Methylovulum psychrotolerans]